MKVKNEVPAIFDDQLKLIKSTEIYNAVKGFMYEKVPEYFYHVPASSTGKHHPSFDQGEGGLVRHTKMLVEVAKELVRINKYDWAAKDFDIIVAACLLHDTFKNGYCNLGRTVASHAGIAADEFYDYGKRNFVFVNGELEKICSGIAEHMGQWGREKCLSDYGQFIFLCDYIASRKFFDYYNSEEVF